MPAKTAKMQRFMGMCAHNPKKAEGKCPSHKVAEEFSHKPRGGYKGTGRTFRMPKKDKNGYF